MSKTLFSQARPATRPHHPLSRDEHARLISKLSLHYAEYVNVAVYTGARRSELEAFQAYDFDLVGGLVRISGGKTGPDRYVPLAAELRPFIEQHPGGKLLFAWPAVVLGLASACRAAGIMPRVPSDLRNTFSLWQARAGVSPREIARRMGHSWPDDDERQDPERDPSPRWFPEVVRA